MDIRISPCSLRGEIASIPSKSRTHRALICSALADVPTRLRNPVRNDDIEATLGCLRALGAEFEEGKSELTVFPIKKAPAHAELDCRESGSTLRFLLPLASAIIPEASFTGSGSLPSRPIGGLMAALAGGGAAFTSEKLPFTVSGELRPGIFEIAGDVSSQYISGLLMALPLLGGDSRIVLISPLCSSPYVQMTLDTLRDFGLAAERTQDGFFIPGGQNYRSPGSIDIDGDWSAAAFFLAAGAIGGDVTVGGLNLNSSQGDRAIIEALYKFGAEAEIAGDTVRVRKASLRACELDVSAIPDLFPILAVTACFAEGKTLLCNASHLRFKESDRIKATAELINSLGGKAAEYHDRLEITGTGLLGGTAESFGDHRIAMSAAIAASCCEGETLIRRADAVSKSYPEFFKDFASLGGKVESE